MAFRIRDSELGIRNLENTIIWLFEITENRYESFLFAKWQKAQSTPGAIAAPAAINGKRLTPDVKKQTLRSRS